MTSEKLNELLKEAVATCAFYDRSHFYANSSLGNAPHSPYLIFQKKISFISKALLEKSPKRVAYAESRCIWCCEELCRSYPTAMRMLLQRLKTVADEYAEQRTGTIGMLIRLTDRQISMTRSTAPKLMANSAAIVKVARRNLVKAKRRMSLDRIPSNEWRSVREKGQLLMDEITFLSGRVDHINNLRNSIYALMLALGGIGIGAALTLLSIFVSILISNTGK